MSLDPSPHEMARLGCAAAERVAAHSSALGTRRPFSPPQRDTLEAVVAEPLPAAGFGIDACLRRFFDDFLPHATLVNHPRFFAYVPGPGSFAGAIGAFCAAASNLFVGTWLGGAVAAQLEVQVLDWLRQALGLSPEWSGGILTTGGSMANLNALAAARARGRARSRPGFCVYVSAEAHYSVTKAARVLGIADGDIVTVPADDAQRLCVGSLRAAMAADARVGRAPGVVIATMGTTSTGAVDDIDACADACAAHGAWLHVDGAYGAALALLPEQEALRAQLARADSIALDPHKGLYTPFECGCLLVQDLAALRAAFTADAGYMQDVPRDEVNFFERGPELSRGARAAPLWFVLRSLGLDAIRDALRADVAHTHRAAQRLARDPRIRIVTPPATTVFTFTVAGGTVPAQALLRRIHADGFVMLSSTRVGGEFVLRWCVLNHRTTDLDVDAAVDRVHSLLDQA